MAKPEFVTNLTGNRKWVADLVEGQICVGIITGLILLNAVTLGLETDKTVMASYGSFLIALDYAILVAFTIELAAKFYAYRLDFFRSGWNIFDFLIVVISWMPSSGPFAILRALRILRILRLLSVVPQLRRVISAIGHSIPGMLSVIGVLSIIFYVSAVLSTKSSVNIPTRICRSGSARLQRLPTPCSRS